MDPKPPSGPTSPIKDETINSCSSEAVSSPVLKSTDEPTNGCLSLKQSPPVQVMERPDDLDFSSRFSSSSSAWSSDSDDSLFSIRFTGSYKHDQAHLPERSGQSDVDVHASNLDEPQKCVRWKTQVERLADEGVSSQCQQVESSSLKDHKSSEPKNKLWWSKCECGPCNLPNWSCWSACWKNIKCCNCKPKKIHSKEANAPASDALKKPGSKHQKTDLKKCSCCESCLACFRSCSCHCCLGDISTTA